MRKFFITVLLCLFMIPMISLADEVNENIVFHYTDYYILTTNALLHNENDGEDYMYANYVYFKTNEELNESTNSEIAKLKEWLQKRNVTFDDTKLEKTNNDSNYLEGTVTSGEDVLITLNPEYEDDYEKLIYGSVENGTVDAYVIRYHMTSLSYEDDASFETVDYIEISNVNTNLEVGKKPEFTGEVQTEGFKLLNESWIAAGEYYVSVSKDINYDEKDASSDYIINNNKYGYSFNVQTDLLLSQNLKVKVNDVLYENVSVNEREVNNVKSYELCIEDIKNEVYDENYEIKEVVIESVDTMLYDGELPQFTAKTGSDNYTIMYEAWLEDTSNDRIFNYLPSNEKLTSELGRVGSSYYEFNILDKVTKDREYTYSIRLKPLNGYSFSKDLKILVNGEEIECEISDEIEGDVLVHQTALFADNLLKIKATTRPVFISKDEELKLSETKNLVYKVDKDYSLFTRVLIDGNEIPKENYDSYSGSTVVELSNAYLKSLTKTEHTLSILFSDGTSADTKFTIVDDSHNVDNPTQTDQEPTNQEQTNQEPTNKEQTNQDTVVQEQESTKPTNTSSQKTNTENPLTNDNIMVYVNLLIMSLIGFVLIFIYAYKFACVRKD